MREPPSRFQYLFTSTRGLVLVAAGLLALVTVIWGTLSGPLADWGVKEITVDLLGMKLVESEREGRIVILYHAIAMAVVAILVYWITDLLPMKQHQRAYINATVTAGYLLSLIFGLGFAYFGHSWLFHGIYLAGLTLVFAAGILLAVALWPWRREYRNPDPEYAHWGSVDLERVAFFTITVCTLASAAFGAWAGASFGNGFETFLAEDVIREPHKTDLQMAVIGHLHIMVALVGMMVTLIIGRWFDFKGILHKWGMPLMIVGAIIITAAVLLIIPLDPYAHMLIYVGAVPSMLCALLLVIFGWAKLIRTRLEEQGLTQATFGQKLRALFHDPLRFGSLWQMVFMNFCVSFVGIFMAITLEETMRVIPAREERITLTGHWHILSVIIASIMLFYALDRWGLKDKFRKLVGWAIIIGSDVAFAAVTVYSMKSLLLPEWQQQGLVDTTMLLADAGLGAFLVALGAYMIWRLVDLFRRDGHWRDEAMVLGAAETEQSREAIDR